MSKFKSIFSKFYSTIKINHISDHSRIGAPVPFKGKQYFGSGIIYAPYTPLYVTSDISGKFKIKKIVYYKHNVESFTTFFGGERKYEVNGNHKWLNRKQYDIWKKSVRELHNQSRKAGMSLDI